MKKVIIIGAGFGGLALAKKLIDTDYDVTLIDRNNYHTFQPLLYQVATGGLEAGNIAYPVRRTFRKSPNFHFKMGEVQEVVLNENKIKTTIGSIHYDYLVLAQGSTTNFFGNKEIEQNSITLKSVADALDFRSKLIQNLESSIDALSAEEAQEIVNIAIVGGGPAGLEMAGALAEMKKFVLPKDYPEIDFSLMHIQLYEAGEMLLANMSQNASDKALSYLQKLGVEVRLNTSVVNFNGKRVELKDGSFYPCETLMWTAGVKANSIPGLESIADARSGRLPVNQFNQLNQLDNVFAIGDISLQIEEDYSRGIPMLATAAIQQGQFLGENLIRLSKGKSLKSFSYRNKGVMATIGRNRAVADFGKLKISGFFAWFLWMGVHIYSLVGFRNKMFSLLTWSINYFNYDRPLGLVIRKYKGKQIEQ